MAVVRDLSGNLPKSLDGVGIDPPNAATRDPYNYSVRNNANFNATLTAQSTLSPRDTFGNTASGHYRLNTSVAIRVAIGPTGTAAPTINTGVRIAANAESLINIKPTDIVQYIAESATGSWSLSELGA